MAKLDRLQSVELRDIWSNEATDFTPWLAEEENLTLLGETLGMEFELEGQELNVGNFRADILCRNTEDDSRVLIENQLEQTNHAHLGQILTYAAGLDAHTVIWIAREFREEHRAAFDRQNEITDERFRYFGIEIKVWQIGDSARAPQFEIVSSPNDWSRTVSWETQRVENNNISESQLLRKKFWTKLRDHMIQRGSPVKLKKPTFYADHDFGMGTSNFTLAARQNSKDNFIAAIFVTRKTDAKRNFNLLEKQRQEIEKEFGEPLKWEKRPDYKESQILLEKKGTDPTDETDWPNQHEWLASKLELFDKVFRPRIKALNAGDWEPPEDDNGE